MALPTAQPKPRPHLLTTRKTQADLARVDREERAKCHARSEGRCEVRTFTRCRQRATENHHLIGGIGRKNKGKSILAAHRLDVCKVCHRELTNHVLVPAVERRFAEAAATVRYERIR